MAQKTTRLALRDRRHFIGGSDARIIMGDDEGSLLRLWREKRGEVEPEDLSGNLIVQLGVVTEPLNRHWFERNTGHALSGVQRRVQHPVVRYLAATLDGIVEGTGAVFEAKFMLPWSFSEEERGRKIRCAAATQYVGHQRQAVGALDHHRRRQMGRDPRAADPLYQHLLLTAEKKFWRCVESGEPPRLFGIEPPRPRLEAVRIVDMSASNSWAEFADIFIRTRDAHLEHEQAKAELKGLVPEDAQQAIGHGVRARRSKSGAISLDLLKLDGESHAAVQ